MNISEIEALADRLRGLIRYAETFNQSRSDILGEVDALANDLQKYAADLDRYMELEAMADHHDYAMGK